MGKILFYRIVSTFHKEKSYKRVEGGGGFFVKKIGKPNFELM